jgi:23S rRNA (uridine2552-2'-O)-methyltransferase
MQPVENVAFIQGDIQHPETLERIEKLTEGSVDLVLADCSPKVSGTWDLDVARQISLVERTVYLSEKLLSDHGKMLTKVFQGPGFQEFLVSVRTKFNSVKLIKPDASRKSSAEIYLLAKGPIRKSE